MKSLLSYVTYLICIYLDIPHFTPLRLNTYVYICIQYGILVYIIVNNGWKYNAI